MLHLTIHLKEHFPILSDISADPTLITYIPYNQAEMGWQDNKYPAILICPGGGYSWVSTREDEPVALKLLAWGYRVFILNYSCAPCHFPAQLCEVAAAMELIHTNADNWHIDTKRIAMMGFSAGGHLTAHYSNCYNLPQVRQLFPDSKPVAASVLCYPVISAEPTHRHEGTIINVSGHSVITEADVQQFSLNRHVSPQTPPTFLWHTAEDDVVPVSNSLLYAHALTQHSIPFALHIYPYGQHGLSTADSLTNEPLDAKSKLTETWLSDLKAWLNVTL